MRREPKLSVRNKSASLQIIAGRKYQKRLIVNTVQSINIQHQYGRRLLYQMELEMCPDEEWKACVSWYQVHQISIGY